MIRCLPAVIIALSVLGDVRAEELKVVELVPVGSIDDETLQKAAPGSSVIASAADLEKLCKTWKINPPKVDFAKQLVIVGTWKGSSFSARATLTKGDVQVSFAGTKDLRPGFRYLLAAVSRDGVKSINGKDLLD